MPFQILFALAAAIGVSPSPCPPQPTFAPDLVAWRAKVYAPDNGKIIPPPTASATSYRDAYLKARTTDWADICHFRDDNSRLAGLPQSERQVVFMGDSITEAWKFGDPGFFRHGWIDRGISGQTTPQMLVRFPEDVIALHPRVVHIMAGTNDVAGNTGPTTIDAIEANIAAMVVLAKAAGIHVVLAATPPAAKFTWAPDLKPAPEIAELNRRLRALAAREHVIFVDYSPVLASSDGAMRDQLTLDGVHPNAKGYAAMRPLADSAIASAAR